MKLPKKSMYIPFEIKVSGPMGKARNLALATSIAVQEGRALFTFFY